MIPIKIGTTPKPRKKCFGRDDWIRTSGPFVPNEVRYRAALHPENKNQNTKIKKGPQLCEPFIITAAVFFFTGIILSKWPYRSF